MKRCINPKLLLMILSVSVLIISGCVTDSMVDQVILHDTECEEFGGDVVELMECDGSLSQVCVMKGQQCYVESFKNGRCMADLTPRVECDELQ